MGEGFGDVEDFGRMGLMEGIGLIGDASWG